MRFGVVISFFFSVLVSVGAKAQVYQFPENNRWVDSVFNTLTREERIAQLIMASVYSTGPDKNYKEVLGLVKKYKIGGVCFFKGTPEAEVVITNSLQKNSKIPLLVAMDAEWGVGMRLDNVIRFPRPMSLSAMDNDSLIYLMGKEVAAQCKALGVHINFAPVADINYNHANPVINDRSFGDDKYGVTLRSLLYMKGMQDNGIGTCLKHFPGHGDTKVDSHYDLPLVDFPVERLDTLEFYPFRELIKQGAMGVMVAHMRIPSIDSTPNLAVSLSPAMVNGYLKDSMGFKGLIFTDAMTMKGVAAYYTQAEIAIKSLQAGNDVLLCPLEIPSIIEQVKLALDSNLIDSNAFHASVKKVLAAKYEFGLTKTPVLPTKNIRRRVEQPSAFLLQDRMVEQQITVVKNSRNLLPIKHPEKKKIASIALGEDFKTPFQKMLNNYARMDFYQFDRAVDTGTFSVVLQTLKDKKYDIIIVSIHNTNRTPEKFYGISQAAIDFVNRLKEQEKMLLVSFGIPYNLNFFPGIKNLMVAYQDAEINQEKAAQMIFGVFNNKAVLPVNISDEYPKYAGITTDKQKQLLHYATPEVLGYNSHDFGRLDAVINTAIKQQNMPGCQLLVAQKGKVIYSKAYGYTTYDKNTRITTDMLYDIASITKIMGTTLAVMKLYEDGKIDINKPASKYLKDLAGTNKKNITIRQLLTHTAGLKAWIPFYQQTLADSLRSDNVYCYEKGGLYHCQIAENIYMRDDYKDTIWKIILDSEVESPGKYVYSDLSFLILQRVVEELAKEPMDVYLEKNFYQPLSLGTMTFKPLEKFEQSRIAPTENDKEFRKQLVWGFVHDPAAAMLGGVAGNAGLFSNANDIAIIMQMLLNNGEYAGRRYFKKETVELFTAKQLDQCRRGLGFDKPEPDKNKGNPTADIVPCAAFGHSGFTGTVTWADPENQLIYVFLSNRVNPTAENNLITKNNIRSRLHEIIYDIVLKK